MGDPIAPALRAIAKSLRSYTEVQFRLVRVCKGDDTYAMARKKFVPELVTDLSDSKRLEILNEHAMLEGQDWKSIDDTMFCHHCDREFSGRSVRILKNPEFPDGFEVQCGSDGCDGSPLDWSKKPWWRGQK